MVTDKPRQGNLKMKSCKKRKSVVQTFQFKVRALRRERVHQASGDHRKRKRDSERA